MCVALRERQRDGEIEEERVYHSTCVVFVLFQCSIIRIIGCYTRTFRTDFNGSEMTMSAKERVREGHIAR